MGEVSRPVRGRPTRPGGCAPARPRPEANDMSFLLIIPEYDGDEPYPGGIEPGYYDLAGLVALLRRHKDDPEAISFLADMLEG